MTACDPWVVFKYEVEMFQSTLKRVEEDGRDANLDTWEVRNAMVESAVLHARILADILLGTKKKGRPDDISVNDLVPGFQSNNTQKLRNAYGSSELEGSPCWTFNKMLAHPTKHRSSSYNYGPALRKIEPLIDSIVREVWASQVAADQ